MAFSYHASTVTKARDRTTSSIKLGDPILDLPLVASHLTNPRLRYSNEPRHSSSATLPAQLGKKDWYSERMNFYMYIYTKFLHGVLQDRCLSKCVYHSFQPLT
jgi:hypothetical protein